MNKYTPWDRMLPFFFKETQWKILEKSSFAGILASVMEGRLRDGAIQDMKTKKTLILLMPLVNKWIYGFES